MKNQPTHSTEPDPTESTTDLLLYSYKFPNVPLQMFVEAQLQITWETRISGRNKKVLQGRVK